MAEIISRILDGICTLNEVYFLYWIIGEILELRNDNRAKIKKALVVVVGTVMTLGMNSIVLTSAYTTMMILVYSCVTVLLFWKCDIFQAIALTGSYFLFILGKGIFEITIGGGIGGDGLIQKTMMKQGVERCIYLVIAGSTLWMIMALLHRIIKKRRISIENMKYQACISVMGICGMAFISVQVLSGFGIEITAVYYAFLIVLSVLIFTGYYMMQYKRLAEQVKLLDSRNELLEKSYDRISDIYSSNARLYHDMKHHLNALQFMMEEGKEEEAKEYLAELCPKGEILKNAYTGIDILDVILSEKKYQAENRGIKMVIDAQQLPQNISIEKKDICAVFANLLDNAIEAASGYIQIKIRFIRQMLAVCIKNDYRRELKEKNGIFISTKREEKLHGWGLKSVEKSVEKYQGTIEYKTENGEFCVKLMMNYFV